MATKYRAEISPKNKYWISKHRFYEISHHCYQYGEWKDEVAMLNDVAIKGLDYDKPPADPYAIGDATANIATRMAQLRARMELIEQTAEEADPIFAKYLLKAVTEENITYNYLRQVMGMLCSRNHYYECRRRFYWLMSKKI